MNDNRSNELYDNDSINNLMVIGLGMAVTIILAIAAIITL